MARSLNLKTIAEGVETEEHILLKNADLAMYQAKQIGRDRYQLYKEAF